MGIFVRGGRLGIGRRRILQGLAAATLAGGTGVSFRGASAAEKQAGANRTEFDLSIGALPMNIAGEKSVATTVNNLVPGPLLRWRQGDTVTLNVTNRLSVPTSIHWHGIRTPGNMDGVPGLSFGGIAPGQTFTYRFPVHQHGPTGTTAIRVSRSRWAFMVPLSSSRAAGTRTSSTAIT
jgi:FtsP/CotA-like multicopper oxidase with cupredoxin domain